MQSLGRHVLQNCFDLRQRTGKNSLSWVFHSKNPCAHFWTIQVLDAKETVTHKLQIAPEKKKKDFTKWIHMFFFQRPGAKIVLLIQILSCFNPFLFWKNAKRLIEGCSKAQDLEMTGKRHLLQRLIEALSKGQCPQNGRQRTLGSVRKLIGSKTVQKRVGYKCTI